MEFLINLSQVKVFIIDIRYPKFKARKCEIKHILTIKKWSIENLNNSFFWGVCMDNKREFLVSCSIDSY